MHVPDAGPVAPLERIRDWTVADAIAAAAGTDTSPELVLSNVVTPVVVLQPRPPLAVSGYSPGILGFNVAAVALNTSHAGIFCASFGVDVICRVNWIKIINNSGGDLNYFLNRLDVVAGFIAAETIPAYINAGNPTTGRILTLSRSNTVAPLGVTMAQIRITNTNTETIWGPFILNRGGLLVAPTTVNQPVRIMMGFEVWPAIRVQPVGG